MPILGIWASQDYPRSTNSYESIATATGTGSSGTITFSSIPSTYSHLQIRCIARTDTGFSTDYIQFRLNSDTGSNYTYHALEGDGASAGGYADTAQTFAFATNITGSAATSNIMGTAIIDILDYANTSKYKTVRTIGGQDQNGSGQNRLISNLWLSTSAINSITFTSYRSASWTTSTTFALYGIKGA